MDQRLMERMSGAGYGDEFLALLGRCQLEPFDAAGVGMQAPRSMSTREMEWVARDVGLELDRPTRVTGPAYCVTGLRGHTVVHMLEVTATDPDITQPNLRVR